MRAPLRISLVVVSALVVAITSRLACKAANDSSERERAAAQSSAPLDEHASTLTTDAAPISTRVATETISNDVERTSSARSESAPPSTGIFLTGNLVDVTGRAVSVPSANIWVTIGAGTHRRAELSRGRASYFAYDVAATRVTLHAEAPGFRPYVHDLDLTSAFEQYDHDVVLAREVRIPIHVMVDGVPLTTASPYTPICAGYTQATLGFLKLTYVEDRSAPRVDAKPVRARLVGVGTSHPLLAGEADVEADALLELTGSAGGTLELAFDDAVVAREPVIAVSHDVVMNISCEELRRQLASVDLRVLGASTHAPSAGASVFISGVSESRRTDMRGAVRFDRVTPGEHVLTVLGVGNKHFGLELVVAPKPGEHVDLGDVLVPDETWIRVRVVGDAPKPGSGCGLAFTPLRELSWRRPADAAPAMPCDDDANDCLRLLADRYVVRATASNAVVVGPRIVDLTKPVDGAVTIEVSRGVRVVLVFDDATPDGAWIRCTGDDGVPRFDSGFHADVRDDGRFASRLCLPPGRCDVALYVGTRRVHTTSFVVGTEATEIDLSSVDWNVRE